MQNQDSDLTQDNYQSIIELMQAYDCSYEQAQQHFQMLRVSKETKASVNQHSFSATQRFKQDQFVQHYEVLDADTIIPFTAKEYRALKLFFSGNMNYSKKKVDTSFCHKVTTKFKDLRRKIKCLKYLNPKRLWRVIRRKRSTSNYNRLTNNESTQSQAVKVGNQRWFQVDQDWMDQLQQNNIELTNYLTSHKDLLRQVVSINREGVKSTLPETMDLPPSLQPYLFVREQAADIIASNVKVAAENYKDFNEQKIQKPKSINYHQRRQIIIDKQKEIQFKEEEAIAEQNKKEQQARKQQQQKRREEKRLKDKEVVEYEEYYKTLDWKRDKQQGGLLFINEDKKSLQPKIFTFLISKFISTGSFMGISFPVFAMKPQSILQTYCRCLSYAPRLLTGLKNPIERIKAFNAVILTFSLRFIDIDKSFNPTIGETFQTFIQGYQITAEQVSHHPPISSFLLYGEDFRINGFLEVQASMGFNTARGRFYGDIVVEYSDGGKMIGRLPCGILSGYLFGRYVFYPDGANYIYDPFNQLLCSYQATTNDLMQGYIGKVNYNAWMKFCKFMNANESESQRKKRYDSYEHIKEVHCQKIYSRLKAIWDKSITYDDKLYLDFQDQSTYPPKLSKKIPKILLPSDSRHRKDISLRQQDKIDESQQQKQRIEQEQRRLRKLRQTYKQQNDE